MAYASNVFVAKTAEQKAQVKIYNVLRNLAELPKTEVTREVNEFEITTIWIRNGQEYMPDFKLVYCNRKHQYRVYILVGNTSHQKQIAGYCICTIRSGLVAIGFAALYRFLHANRANNKSQSQ